MLMLAHTYPAGQGKQALAEDAPENGWEGSEDKGDRGGKGGGGVRGGI